MNSEFPEKDSDFETVGDAQDVTRFLSGDEPDDGDFDLSTDESSQVDKGVLGLLGEYLLLEPIGAGGMGKVFRAEHRTMNREVALKILGRDIASRPDLLEQFFAEIRAVAKLMHPNIVTAFDAGSVGNSHYLVMELVEGEVLSARIRKQGPLPTSDVVNVLVQTSRALSYAHEQGIVHRDIKPSNMMYTPDGVLKILDFGLARLGKGRASADSAKMFMGTPEYMSPEQIANPESVDARSDLYSLGATLFYLLTGRAMFTGEPMQVARAQLRQKPTPLFVVRGDVDLRLDTVFKNLVAKDPNQRYSSAAELLANLEQLNLAAQTATGSSLKKGAYRLAAESPTSVAFDKSTLARKSQIIAIDLGLTASTAAYYDRELGPQIISVGDGGGRHMRNILWSSGESIKVGHEAVEMRQMDPENVFHSMQRFLGVNQMAKPFGGRKTPPEVLVAALLKQILRHASQVSDGSTSAIVTVPACYDQMHRRAIRNACRIAGIDLLQLIDKPLAAGLSWLDVNCRLSTSPTASLLIVHLGGSGLEASVVRVDGTTATQLGACGHWKLGTQRWQAILADYFTKALKQKTGRSIREDVTAATRLQRTVEMALERLARTKKVDIRFDWGSSSVQQTLTQEGFLSIAPELVTAIQHFILKACAFAKTDRSEIDHVLLAGSVMHMQPIQEVVKRCLPHDVRIINIDKTEFARGAAVQAKYVGALSIKDRQEPCGVGCLANDIALLVDSNETGKQKPRVLLEKATATPASLSRTVRARPIGTQEVLPTLQLIESSSLGDGNWLKLGKAKPSDLFPLRPVDDPLELRLEIDENGILESSVLWPAGNRQARIPASSDQEMVENEILEWRDWLDTIMLCSSH